MGVSVRTRLDLYLHLFQKNISCSGGVNDVIFSAVKLVTSLMRDNLGLGEAEPSACFSMIMKMCVKVFI